MTNEHYTSLEEIWNDVFALKNGFGSSSEIAKKIENSIGRGYRLAVTLPETQEEEKKIVQRHDNIIDMLRQINEEMGPDYGGDEDIRNLK